ISSILYRYCYHRHLHSFPTRRSSDLKIYPNPANDILYVELKENQKIQSLSLFDLQGKELLSETKKTKLDVVLIPTGIYILNVCRSEEHTSELQSREKLVCRLLLEKKK